VHTPIPFLPQQPYDQKGQGVQPFPLELVNLIPSGQPPFEEWELPLRCQMMQSVVTQDPKPGFPTVAGDPKFRPLVCKERNHLNLEAHDDANGSRSSNDHATQTTQRSGIDPVLTPKIGTREGLICGPDSVTNPAQRGKIFSKRFGRGACS
jgi:hypothetical protein